MGRLETACGGAGQAGSSPAAGTVEGYLQALVAKYQDRFKLEPFATAQMAGLAELPTREAGAVPDVPARAVAEATTAH